VIHMRALSRSMAPRSNLSANGTATRTLRDGPCRFVRGIHNVTHLSLLVCFRRCQYAIQPAAHLGELSVVSRPLRLVEVVQ
jgi:hypothetical protein